MYFFSPQFTERVSAEPSVMVHIPPTFQHHVKNTSNVVITSFKRNTLFQVSSLHTTPPKHHLNAVAKILTIYLYMFVFQQAVSGAKVIDEVVEITVGNEIVTDLTDPITIDFYHDVIDVSLWVLCIFVLNYYLQAIGHFDRLNYTRIWWGGFLCLLYFPEPL